MEKNIKILLFVLLCSIILIKVWGEGVSSSATNSSNVVIAQVIDVSSRDDNNWMVAVKNAKGWDVEIKQSIPKIETTKDIFVHMYTRNSPNSFQESLYESSLCELLTSYPNSRFFPRDIVGMILPVHQGSCEIKEGKRQIQSSRCVSTDIQENPGIIFPRSNPYELLVDFLSKTLPDDHRFFRANLMVGNKTSCTYGQNIDNEGNGNSGNKCSKTIKLARPLCKTYEKVISGISEIGKNIVHLL